MCCRALSCFGGKGAGLCDACQPRPAAGVGRGDPEKENCQVLPCPRAVLGRLQV